MLKKNRNKKLAIFVLIPFPQKEKRISVTSDVTINCLVKDKYIDANKIINTIIIRKSKCSRVSK